MRRYTTEIGLCLLLAGATLGVYGQVAGHDFINFDDSDYVFDNPHVLGGLSWSNGAWAFRTTHAANWHPLTWLSLQLDAQCFGTGPRGFHLTNVALHLANTLLLFLVLRWFTGAPWRSWLVAALFALHPQHVESVAWISERKDLLSALFWMLTLAAYGWYVRSPGWLRYCLVVLPLALGLMAKPMLVTLPSVLLLLDAWPLRRWQAALSVRARWGLVAEKLPLFVLSAASSVVTCYAQQRGGAFSALQHLSLAERSANAIVAYASYLRMMFWPVDLAVFYPHRQNFLSPWQVAGALVFLLVVSVFVAWQARRRPYLAVGWLWYLGTLVPVIGLVQVGGQAMADRYTYLPLIGPFVMLAWGLPDLAACLQTAGVNQAARARVVQALVVPAAAVSLVACCVAAWGEVACWRNSQTLWEHALRHHKSSVARTNLGLVLMGQGRTDEAIACLHEATKLADGERQVLATAHVNLGMALLKSGQLDEAVEHCSEAARLQPDLAIAHNNLAVGLERQGKMASALEHYAEALRLDPGYANAHNNLGTALVKKGRYAEAMESYRQAVHLAPSVAKYRYNLASCLQEVGQEDGSAEQFREALRLDGGWPGAVRVLAWDLATSRQPSPEDKALALHFARQACPSLVAPEPEALDTLAAALAASGRFEEAVCVAQKALALIASTGQAGRVKPIEERLRLYENRRPFREGGCTNKAPRCGVYVSRLLVGASAKRKHRIEGIRGELACWPNRRRNPRHPAPG
jgi:tetratricopeptide (TPR) repeat protein